MQSRIQKIFKRRQRFPKVVVVYFYGTLNQVENVNFDLLVAVSQIFQSLSTYYVVKPYHDVNLSLLPLAAFIRLSENQSHL